MGGRTGKEGKKPPGSHCDGVAAHLNSWAVTQPAELSSKVAAGSGEVVMGKGLQLRCSEKMGGIQYSQEMCKYRLRVPGPAQKVSALIHLTHRTAL